MSRYIDADKFSETLRKQLDEEKPLRTNRKKNIDRAFRDGAIYYALMSVTLEKTADVKPVEHAHWTEYYGDIKCTSCGFVCGDEFYLGSKSYCPNCGAKMDEEAE